MSNEFTFTYNATEGVLIAAALREKADAEIAYAERKEVYPSVKTGGETSPNGELARTARNRAKLYSDAADRIHAPVRKALAVDMSAALRDAGILE